MKSQTKIQLSSLEMKLVSNADWILTKNAIMQKTKWLLETLQAKQETHLKKYAHHFPEEVLKLPPKISKGENYKGLPYLVLDYPRYFNKENIFAIRTMFWWGNFFSITLHLSGKYKKQNQQKIIAAYSILKKENYFICTNDDEWEHHFEKNNFIPVNEIRKSLLAEQVQKRSFIKLGQNIPLQQWKDAPRILLEKFKKIIEMLTI